MRANNSGTLTGRVARDPEQKGTGNAVTLFTLAVDGWNGVKKEKETDWIRCTAFGQRGDTIFNYAKQGRWITVAYHLKLRSWEDPTTGQKRSELSVVVDDVILGPMPQGRGDSDERPRQQQQPRFDPRDEDPFGSLPFGDDPDPFSLT